MNIQEFTIQQKKDPTTVKTIQKRRDKYYPVVNFLAAKLIKLP